MSSEQNKNVSLWLDTLYLEGTYLQNINLKLTAISEF